MSSDAAVKSVSHALSLSLSQPSSQQDDVQRVREQPLPPPERESSAESLASRALLLPRVSVSRVPLLVAAGRRLPRLLLPSPVTDDCLSLSLHSHSLTSCAAHSHSRTLLGATREIDRGAARCTHTHSCNVR